MSSTAQAGIVQNFGRYQTLAKLASGPMGLVYQACDPITGDFVAIKVGSAALARDKILLKRFEQEYNCTSKFNHPNIVRALEFGWEAERPFIVMEFVDGENLAERIKRLGKLSEAEAVGYIIQVAQGLHEAHKSGIIHRDIKPENILLTVDGTAKLADLGLSKDLEHNLELTCDNGSLGTPTFIAPEQFGDAKHSGIRCDVYSLGATLYLALTGKLPFPGSFLTTILTQKLTNNVIPPRQLVPELSEHVDRAVRRALLAEPDQRQAACPEFIASIKGEEKRSGLHASAPRKSAARKPKVKPVRPAKERRVAVRYEVALPTTCTVNLSVHPDSTEVSTPWDAQVCDLSVTGVGLILTRRFEPRSILTITLSNKVGDFTRTREVRVMHVVRAEGNGWFIGGELTERLSKDEVRQLL